MGVRTANSATELAGHAIEFLRQHDGQKPFFMYLAPPVPHDPRLAPPEFVKLYDPAKIVLPKQFMATHPFDPGVLDIRDEQLAPYPRTPGDMRQHLADYFATITHLDFEVGRILDVLKERGWDKNTIIVFSSDQGLAVGGYHGLMGKQNLYEDVKPPLVIVGPGIPHGQSDALVYLYDLFPTICDLAGVKTPEVAEGRSLLPIVEGKETKIRDWMFGAYSTFQRMVRDDRWKLISYHVGNEKNTQLFDLKNDPWEIDNLANNPSFAAQRARLERQLALSRKEFGDPVDFDGTGAITAPWNDSATATRKAKK
jgi:arylsulfatase A-like enzyme